MERTKGPRRGEPGRLTVATLARLLRERTPGRYADGGGVRLDISESGAASWIFRYRSPVKNTIREMGMGSASTLSLCGSEGGDRRDCQAEAIFDSYVEHAKRQGLPRRAIETTLGMYLHKVFPAIPSPLPKVTIDEKRVPMYRFPPLVECRRRFAEDFGQSLDHLWGDTQEDWETEDAPAETYPADKRW